MNKKQKKILENNFNVYETSYDNEKCLGLEAWTYGGVDMFIEINIKNNVIEELENYLDNFDIDEEIDLYRQDKTYRETFKITESVRDFEDWIKFIEDIIKQLKEAE